MICFILAYRFVSVILLVGYIWLDFVGNIGYLDSDFWIVENIRIVYSWIV